MSETSADPTTQIHSDDQEAQTVTKPSSSSLMMILTLAMKLVTMVCLIVSMSVLASNGVTLRDFNGLDETVHFNDIYAYRYALSVAVLVLAYNLVELLFLIYQVIAPVNDLSNKSFLVLFSFYADKVVLSLLATGVGAAFGYTVDRKRIDDALVTELSPPLRSKIDDFFNRAYIASTFLLIAVLTSLVSSVLSSLALAKTENNPREAN